jgi:flagellar hook assembly protein FlgD
LLQNYPNPFNLSTTSHYSIQRPDFVHIAIYDELGRLIRTLANEQKPASEFNAIWDGKNEQGKPVSSGMYFYILKIGKNTLISKRLIMMQ